MLAATNKTSIVHQPEWVRSFWGVRDPHIELQALRLVQHRVERLAILHVGLDDNDLGASVPALSVRGLALGLHLVEVGAPASEEDDVGASLGEQLGGGGADAGGSSGDEDCEVSFGWLEREEQ